MKTKERDGRVVRAERKRRERRETVLLAASRVFAQKGYHAASIEDILSVAGIARGTFYLYFESKRAIFDELLDTLLDHLRGEVRVVDVGPGARPPKEQLEALVRHIFATLLQNADLTRILLREATGIDSDFDQKLADFYGRLLLLLRSALERGEALGLVKAGSDRKVLAWCMLGSVKELVAHALLEAESPDAVNLDQLTRTILDFNLSGVFQQQ